MMELTGLQILDELKRRIIDHIDQGKKLERFQNEVLSRYAAELKVPTEKLEGFIQGIQVALRMIAAIEKGQ